MKRILPTLVLAALGLGVSVVIETVHRRLAADVNYASFCNLSASVNCDVVLGSRYATLAGVSIATWAMVYYATLIGAALGTMTDGGVQRRARLGVAVLLLSVWGALFSIYMAVIAFGILHTVCAMCSALYLINTALFVTAWRLRTKLRAVGRRQAAEHARQDRLVLVGSLAATLALVLIGSWEAFGRGIRPSDAAAVARQRPDFYRWYLAQPLANVPVDGTHARGSTDARVTLVEFSDFECGHCAAFHRSLEEVLRRFGQGVRVVFHHFPLDSACNPTVPAQVHPSACLAAVASECAAEQGKFWQYHNLLFENQQRLEQAALVEYATRLGLDIPRFTACLGSDAPRAQVERDARAGAALGVDSTPTVFINGRTVKGALETDLLGDALTLAGTPAAAH